MELSRIYISILFLNILIYCTSLGAQTTNNFPIQYLSQNTQAFAADNIPPIAINDTFLLLKGCGRNSISGNILANDFDPNKDEIILYFIVTPKVGEFKINKKGDFTYKITDDFLGDVKVEYYIKEVSKNNYFDLAEVIFYVRSDCDFDNIPDNDDLDTDNDGILNIDEGNGIIDSDSDGIPDSFDIDSDNDGITDNEEWQMEGLYIEPSRKDINNNGWDDAYDNSLSIAGCYYMPIDSDNDGKPDFIDNDSDGDGISDYIEGCDVSNNCEPNINVLNSDSDKDGLDDAFDIIQGWKYGYNPGGSCAPCPDLNKNGIREWRDPKTNFLELISIYPNPSNGTFTLNLPQYQEQQKDEILIYSLNGKLLYEKTINTRKTTINLTNLYNGIYILKIQSNSFVHSKRIIINH